MKRGLFLFFAFCSISNAYAQMECESIPSCAEMGYTQDSCAGGKGIRCPFDETKFYCAGAKQLPDAPEPVITPEDWTAGCADKIDHCMAYNADCQCTACEEKYLLADNICTPECVKADHICLVWDYDICKCTKCPDGYEPNEYGICVKQTACDITKVEHCAAYDSDYEPCECQTCETDYLLDEGVCKKMCTIVANCTTYDSEYDPCTCTACKDGFTLTKGTCLDPCVEKCKTAYPLFAGQDNTNAAIDQLGNKALATYVANQFYVGDKNGDFGQGKWYLPSIGEWMYFWGTDVTQMTDSYGNNDDVKGNNRSLINATLNKLAGKGIKTNTLGRIETIGNDLYQKYLWSSSELESSRSWILLNTGNRGNYDKYKSWQTAVIRCSMFVKNIFTASSGETAPKIGDVMYLDKTYGSVEDYDNSKTAVGVISSVSKDGRDVTIINLKDLTFSSLNTADDFDPENPYDGARDTTYWSIDYTDISEIPNISSSQFLELAKASDNCPCHFYEPNCKLNTSTCAAEYKVFDETSCSCKNCDDGYIFENGVCVVDPCAEKCTTAYPLFAGQENTKAAIDQIGNKALAAYATSQFYVGDKNGDFGQGKWYLPSMGEWLYTHGTDANQMTRLTGSTGAKGDNMTLINDALTTLANKGVKAETVSSDRYWSSSEFNSRYSYVLFGASGYRNTNNKDLTGDVLRPFLLLKDCYNPSSNRIIPKIGDVMYLDKTYGSATNYDGSKTPVGVISSVAPNGRDVTIINLKDLTFSSNNTVENFNPENPYGESENTILWCTSDKSNEDITEIKNILESEVLTILKASDNCPCQFYPSKTSGDCSSGIIGSY